MKRLKILLVEQEQKPECQVPPGCRNLGQNGECCGLMMWVNRTSMTAYTDTWEDEEE